MTPRRLAGIVTVADLAGTAVFAAEGAMAAIAARLDLLGVAVVGFVTAVGGGMLRDVLLGASPPAALRDRRYPAAILAGIAVAALAHATPAENGAALLMVADAAGLALFAVAGTIKALEFGSWSVSAIMMGAMTATGGGVARDVLLAQVPAILRTDFYATAAIAGAASVVAARRAGVPVRLAAILGGGACFILRVLGAVLGWHLPTLG